MKTKRINLIHISASPSVPRHLFGTDCYVVVDKANKSITYPIRKELASSGFQWSTTGKCWYVANERLNIAVRSLDDLCIQTLVNGEYHEPKRTYNDTFDLDTMTQDN